MRLGVLAIQGAFQKHFEVLKSLGQPEPILVRQPEELENLDALFLPGGESTTMSKLLRFSELEVPLKERLSDGLPIFATCAGLILLASEIKNATKDQSNFSSLDISVTRNAYGAQIKSFEAGLDISVLEGEAFLGVFIRSPIINKVGTKVKVLANNDENPVLLQQDNILAATFHPELSGDTRLHQYFLENMIV